MLTAPLFLVFGTQLARAPDRARSRSPAVAALVVWRVGRRTIGEPAAAVAGGAVLDLAAVHHLSDLSRQQDFYASELRLLRASLLLLGAARRRAAAFQAPGRAVRALCSGSPSRRPPRSLPDRRAAVDRVDDLEAAARRCATCLDRDRLLAVVGAAAVARLEPPARLGARSTLPVRQQDATRTGSGSSSRRSCRWLLGLRAPFSQELLLPGRADVASLRGARRSVRRRRGERRARRKHRRILYRRSPPSSPVVYALAPQTSSSSGEPRYLVVLTPVIVLLVAQVGDDATRAPSRCSRVALADHGRSPCTGWTYVPSAVRAAADFQRSPRATSARSIATLDRLGRRPRLRRLLARVPARLRHGRAHHRSRRTSFTRLADSHDGQAIAGAHDPYRPLSSPTSGR